MSYAPASLIGVLWVQFALAVTEDQTIRTCKHCQRVFEVSKEPTGARTRADSEFCSVNCKSRDYRKRRGQAKQLWQSGVSAREIAKVVATSPKTIGAWIKLWATDSKSSR